jgi:hypothetical protein
MGFMGGSAYAMAHQIGEGFLLITERTFGRMAPPELDKLSFEMERLMREVRAEQPSLDDVQALQKRNRKISRLQGAMTMLQSFRMRRRS